MGGINLKKILSVILLLAVLFTIPAIALAEEESQPGPLSYKYTDGL